MNSPTVPRSAFPAALEGEYGRDAANVAAVRQAKHDGFGRIRLGARLDIRRARLYRRPAMLTDRSARGKIRQKKILAWMSEMPHTNGTFAWVLAPDGNAVELWEPKPQVRNSSPTGA
jgi:hypothetical protein